MPGVHKWAYDFHCNQSIESILDAFNATGPWQWQMRESVIFGNYLSCRPNDWVWIRVHEYSQMGRGPVPLFATEHFLASAARRDGGFAASLQINDENSAKISCEIDQVCRRLLQGINARKVAEITPYD
jgi:hypothetical protein